MFLTLLFVASAILFIPVIVINLRSPNRNDGLTLAAVFSIFSLLCEAGIMSVSQPDIAMVLLHLFYIAHAWLFSFVALFILQLGGRERKLWTCPVFYVSIAQTAVLLCSLIHGGMLKVVRRTVWGRSWWITVAAGGAGYPLFQLYTLLVLAGILGIILVVCLEVRTTARLFRPRLYSLIAAQFLYSGLEVFTLFRLWPVWVCSLLLLPICIGGAWGILYAGERTLTEKALLTFADGLSEGFVLFDERDRLIYVNDRLKRILPPELIETFIRRDSFYHWTQELTEISGVLIKKIECGPQTYYFHIHEHAIGDDIARVGTFYSLEDITDTLQKFEAMSEANEQLERSARIKSDFLANMSHEIRTPMNAVIGMAEMALREDLPERARDCLNQIKTSGHNLLNIINDILDFSKIESGKMDIITGEYAPLSEYHDIADTLMTRVGDRNLELVVNVAPDLPGRLEGDSMRIRQVMINLANNAVKFTKTGKVGVDISFSWLSDDMISLLVHVTDTGMGIRKEDLNKLFVSFQQVDSKRNRLVEGTGLGLAISKRLVQAMGGRIGVSSEYGKGSDFYFEIPQKVIDAAPSITVEESSRRFCLGMFANEYLKADFLSNMASLGIPAGVPDYGEDPVPRAVLLERCFKEDGFLFYEEGRIQPQIMEFLEQNRNVTGIMLTPFDARICPESENVRAIRRPFSTFGLAMGLNNESILRSRTGSAFSMNFTAPDAKVLIVDDNPVNLTVACGLLDPLGMQIETAQRGSTAIEMMRVHHFDIVFMDHMMPEMDGVEATRHIREEIPEAADTPIIALTANAVAGAREMFLKNGMNDFVPKPIEVEAIVTKVREYLPEEMIIEKSPEELEAASKPKEETLEIPGIDTGEAIARVGSLPLYRKIAADYYRTLPESLETIRGCLGAEDWENYTIKVHALKSASKQVGASGLSEMAAALEKAGHEGRTLTIREDTPGMLEEAERVYGLLRPVFGETEEKVLCDFDPAQLREDLVRLKKGCEELDMDVMEEVRGRLQSCRFEGAEKEAASELIAAIESMDVDACLKPADRLMELISQGS